MQQRNAESARSARQLMDYHHHSLHSFDSKAVMADICRQAIENGVKEICFTEHSYLHLFRRSLFTNQRLSILYQKITPSIRRFSS